MLSTEIVREVRKLEEENQNLRDAIEELGRKMERNEVLKPKSCQYCLYYIQHYRKKNNGEFVPIYAGHCVCEVPVKKGRKSNPAPDNTCPYFTLSRKKAQEPEK